MSSKFLRKFFPSSEGVCSVRSINAEVLEGLVLKRIEEIAENEILLMRLVSKASGEVSFKVKDLEEKRVLLKLRIKELEKKGTLFANKLIEIEGKSAERFILKEIEAVDKRLKELEEDLKRVEFDIERWSDYVLNAEIIRDSFCYFSRVFPQLSPQEKKSLIRLLVKEVIFSNEEVVIDFFEVPEEELQLESIQKVGFDQPFNWLPEDRAMRNFKDILKVEVIKGKGHPHRLKVLAH